MVKLTLEYFPINSNVAFLRIKQWVFRTYSTPVSNFWYTAFYIHVITSTFCLLAGFTQFFKSLIFTKWHRFFGKFYIIVVLGLAAPSGLIMSFFANGGITSIVAFVTLSVLWIFSTIMALVTVKQKKVCETRCLDDHQLCFGPISPYTSCLEMGFYQPL
jgi:hypothetical protein